MGQAPAGWATQLKHADTAVRAELPCYPGRNGGRETDGLLRKWSHLTWRGGGGRPNIDIHAQVGSFLEVGRQVGLGMGSGGFFQLLRCSCLPFVTM